MDSWVTCKRCSFSRETLLIVPCCKAEFCAECLTDRSRCPSCVAQLKSATLLPKASADSFAAMMASVLKTCSYAGCNYQTTSLLIAFHESRCKFAAKQLEERHPDLVSSFCDPHMTQAAVTARREENILSHFLKYGNVQSVLAAQQTSSYPDITPNGEAIEVDHLIVDSDTLPGLALKYGTNESEIRSLNRMLPKDNIQSRVALRIPSRRRPQYSRADFDELIRLLQQKLVHKFNKATDTTDNQEALYYLESADFSLEHAVALKKADDSWEAVNSHPNALQQLELETPYEKIPKRRCCSVLQAFA